jgi:outer membrane murein-binding lipoprotein Lpp
LVGKFVTNSRTVQFDRQSDFCYHRNLNDSFSVWDIQWYLDKIRRLMGSLEFCKKYDGQKKGFPTDNDYPGECLSIAKIYIKEMFGIDPPSRGNNRADGYWLNFPNPLGQVFDKVPYSEGKQPEVGDIVIWNLPHIDIVTGNISPNGFDGFDQNWPVGSKCHFQRHDNYNNVLGWLHPKNNSQGDIMTYDLFSTPDGAVYERLNNYALVHIPNPDFAAKYYGADWASKVQKVDDIWTVGWIAEDPRPLKQQISDLVSQVSTEKAQIETLQTQISDLVAQVESIKKDYRDITKELQDARDLTATESSRADLAEKEVSLLQDKLDTINKPNVPTGGDNGFLAWLKALLHIK